MGSDHLVGYEHISPRSIHYTPKGRKRDTPRFISIRQVREVKTLNAGGRMFKFKFSSGGNINPTTVTMSTLT